VAEATDPVRLERAVARLRSLSDQFELRVPLRQLDVARVFDRFPLRGIGPRRLADLTDVCGGELHRILGADDERLGKAAGSAGRVGPVRSRVLRFCATRATVISERQLEEAKANPNIEALVTELLGKGGTAFEPPVCRALRLIGVEAENVPEEEQVDLPDIRGTWADGRALRVECKTTTNEAQEVSQRDAHELFKKKLPRDFDGVAFTVGRAIFSFHAVEEAMRAKQPQRLVTVGALIELLLAVRLRGLSAKIAHQVLTGCRHIDVPRVKADIRRLINA
jgi:hypothetical protein